MTVVAVPAGLEQRVVGLCVAYSFRPISPVIGDGTLTWDPDLTAAEQTQVTRIIKLATSLVQGISPDEWAAIEPDIAGLQTFAGIATPTLAQTVQAVKAQSRILRALIKN